MKVTSLCLVFITVCFRGNQSLPPRRPLSEAGKDISLKSSWGPRSPDTTR